MHAIRRHRISHHPVTAIVKSFYEQNPFPFFIPDLKNLDDLKSISVPKKVLRRCLGISPSALKGKRVLDVGCGTGEYASFYAAHGADVTGIDISKTSIDIARQNAKRLGLDNVHFEQADLFLRDFPEQFDYVFSFGVLHHTANPSFAFYRLATFLKPFGTLTIGIYPKFGRVKLGLKKNLLDILAGDSLEKRLRLAGKFAPHRSNYNNRHNWLMDQFCHVHESSHTLGEIFKWFDAGGITLTGSSLPLDIQLLKNNKLLRKAYQLLWPILPRHSFIFLSGQKPAKPKASTAASANQPISAEPDNQQLFQQKLETLLSS